MEPSLLANLKINLNLLQQVNSAVVGDLSELAWELTTKGWGTGSSIISSIAQKLQVSRPLVESAVEGIACLLLQISRTQLTEEQFLEATAPLQLETSILLVIFSTYVKHEGSLHLRGVEISSAQFSRLHWRLQSDLATRLRRQGLDPRVILKLDLKKGGTPESVALVADIPNILRWSEMVEQALAESKTQNARRIHRAIS